jgi:hypothetical protein
MKKTDQWRLVNGRLKIIRPVCADVTERPGARRTVLFSAGAIRQA